jgi:hypothetical protein
MPEEKPIMKNIKNKTFHLLFLKKDVYNPIKYAMTENNNV